MSHTHTSPLHSHTYSLSHSQRPPSVATLSSHLSNQRFATVIASAGWRCLPLRPLTSHTPRQPGITPLLLLKDLGILAQYCIGSCSSRDALPGMKHACHVRPCPAFSQHPNFFASPGCGTKYVQCLHAVLLLLSARHVTRCPSPPCSIEQRLFVPIASTQQTASVLDYPQQLLMRALCAFKRVCNQQVQTRCPGAEPNTERPLAAPCLLVAERCPASCR